MNDTTSRQLVEMLPWGYALHRVICDDDGKPIDFINLDINKAFEEITGLKGEQVLQKKFSELDIAQQYTNLIKDYGEIGLSGSQRDFEHYDSAANRWFKIHVYSPEPGYFITLFSDITAEKAEIQEKQAMLTVLSDIIFELDDSMKITNVIVTDESILFLPKGKILNRTISELFPPELVEQLTEALQKARASGKKETTTYSTPFADVERWFSADIHYLTTPRKRFIVNIADITERKKIQDELIDKTNLLETFFSVNLDLLCIATVDGYFVKVNRAWEEILGYSVEDLETRKFLDFIHPDDLSATLQVVSRLKEQEKVLNFVNRYRANDGSYKYIEWRSYPAGELVYAAARDISERMHYEAQLKEQKERFELAVTGSNDGIWDWNLITDETYFSPRWKEQIGYHDDELQNDYKTFAGLLHPDDKAMVLTKIRRYLSGILSSYDVEFRLQHKNGRYRWIQARGAGVRDIEGKLIRMAGSHTDITDRKAREERIQQSEHKLRSYMENAPVSIFISNLKGRFLQVNQAGCDMSGYTIEELRAMTVADFVAPEFQEKTMEMFGRVLAEGHVEGDILARRKNGEQYWSNLVSVKVNDEEIIGFCRDVTERRRAMERETALRKSLELEARKRIDFTRVLVHELKTPLTAIFSTSDIMVDALKEEPYASMARNINRGAENLSQRIEELLDMAKGEIGTLQVWPKPVSAENILAEIVSEMLPSATAKKRTLLLEAMGNLPPVMADEARLRQVVQNLINNAIKFTSDGGTIMVSAGLSDDMITIAVRDNGMGLTEEEQKKIFQPYERLDAERHGFSGLGLGLALCKTLVELHRGHIWVTSVKGEGATFSFTLPLAKKHAEH